MKVVVGLFEQRSGADAAATQLRGAGVSADKITIQDRSTAPDHLVEASPSATTRRVIRFFVLLGGLIFAIFGVSAAVWSVRVVVAADTAGNSLAFAVIAIVVFIVIGLFCGLVIGAFKGRADAEQELQHYRDGLQQGDTMLIVQTDGEMVKRAVATMKRENAIAVMTSSHLQPMQLPPSPEELAAATAAAH